MVLAKMGGLQQTEMNGGEHIPGKKMPEQKRLRQTELSMGLENSEEPNVA